MNNDVASLFFNHLFINITANLLLVIGYRYLQMNYWRRTNHHSWLIAVFCCVSIIACMHYPISVSQGYLMDFRQIGFLLGSIIGGPVVSVMLGAIIIAHQLFLNQAGLAAAIMLTVCMVGVVLAVRPMYWRHERRGKLLIVTGLSLFESALLLLITFMGEGSVDILFFLQFSTFKLITLIAVFYFILQIRKYFQWLEEINQSEKNRIVSQIAASISHEVRNPLTVIRGFIQLIAKREVDQEKLAVYCEMIMAETDRAVSIINDYLSLAKAHEEDAKQLVSVKSEVKYVINVISPYALLQGVELESSIQTEGHIEIDPYKLRQALINLMKNAIEAMPDGGKLTVTAEDHFGSVVIVVGDTGIGMSEDQLMKVGTPFYSTKVSGTGLGMTLVNHVVRSSGGSLSFHSEVGIGTDFKLEFPLVKKIVI
ncbi:MAG: kinE 3 [Paenibacillaceae bacterium]|nr:kinE 3 [Paenibacillaceae bacterium]